MGSFGIAWGAGLTYPNLRKERRRGALAHGVGGGHGESAGEGAPGERVSPIGHAISRGQASGDAEGGHAHPT